MPEIKWYLNDELVTDGWVDDDGALHIDTSNVFKGNLKVFKEHCQIQDIEEESALKAIRIHRACRFNLNFDEKLLRVKQCKIRFLNDCENGLNPSYTDDLKESDAFYALPVNLEHS